MKTFDQIREEAQAVMEISKGMKKRYVAKAVGGDDETDNSMVNVKFNRKIPQKHRDGHTSPNPQPNKDLDRHMKNRTKGVARATGSAKVAKSVAKAAGRAAKSYRSGLDQPDHGHGTKIDKGDKIAKKAMDKATKAVK